MKKKFLAALMIAMGLFTMSACGATEELETPIITPEPVVLNTATPEPTSTEAPTAEPTAEPTPEVMANGLMANGEEHPITDRTVVDGKMQSYLTGEWKDEKVAKRRPMAVMMPNNSAALPQYGISLASIIYEAPVEGRITRLMCFFEDYDELDKIGPVRSSRDYYIYESMAYDAIYVNWGLAIPYVADLINSDRVDNVSQALKGIEVSATEAFARISRPGYKTEYTGYMFIDGYESAVKRLKYPTTYAENGRFEQAFTFTQEGYAATYESYPNATKIYPGGTQSNRGGYGSNDAYFQYNEADGLYYRYQFGDVLKDEYNSEEVTVSNVVFKVCNGEVRDANDYLAFGVHGTGEAYVFTGGKVIKGTWKRNSDYEANIFLDENGNEIVFNQGKTWICNIWKDFKDYMYFE